MADPLAHFEPLADIRVKHAEEIAAIRAKLVEGEAKDDIIVYRYLRGYKFNIDKAAAALDKTLKWRKECNVDAVRERAKDMHQNQFPFADKVLRCHPHRIHHKQDKRGQPLSLERIGHTNPSLLKKLLTLDQLVAYHLYHVENKAHLVAEVSNSAGHVVRTAKIIDLDGLSLRLMDPLGLRYLHHIIALSQDNYPEMLGNLYVINAPWMFKMFWNIVKPWLQPATLEKIQIFGTNDYQEFLLTVIDAENLPTWAGGKCECPGGCVPEIDPSFGCTEVVVPRKGTHTERVDVKEKDTAVSWEFRTQSHDIGFSVCFEPSSPASTRVVVEELKRYDAHKQTIYGMYEAKEPGALVLLWDNSYSRWTDKTLSFRCDFAADTETIHEIAQEHQHEVETHTHS